MCVKEKGRRKERERGRKGSGKACVKEEGGGYQLAGDGAPEEGGARGGKKEEEEAIE